MSTQPATGARRFLPALPIIAAGYGLAVWDGLQKHPDAFQGFGFHPEAILNTPAGIQWHLASAGLAILIGSAQMLRPKGTRSHRFLGFVWVALMILSALGALIGAPRPGPLQALAVVVIGLVVLCGLARAQKCRGAPAHDGIVVLRHLARCRFLHRRSGSRDLGIVF